jgi:hypothetical protein
MSEKRTQLTAGEIRSVCQCGKAGCECHIATGLVHCPAHADGKPSLSVDERNGKPLFKCHSGCPQEAVLKALLQVTSSEPSQTLSNTPNGPKNAKAAAPFDYQKAVIYEYRDEASDLLFQVLRNGQGAKKQIKQRRPDGNGGWLYSLGETRRVLYRLGDVKAASTVLLCEGEKAVETLRALLQEKGLLGQYAATCNPHGAGKWREEYAQTLANKKVFVFPDCDQTGRQHAQIIAASVAPSARETRVVELEGQSEKDGPDDYLTRGNTLGRLLEVAAAAPLWTPTEAVPTPKPQRFLIQSAQSVKSFKTPAALVYGVLYENSAVQLVGAAASFKTGIAMGMAEAIAGGHKWNGLTTQKTPVIYISGEGKGGLGKRIQALELVHKRPCAVQFITEAVQIHRPDEVEALLQAIATLPEKPNLVVVDTLARCFVGGDENSARDAGLFIAGVDRIRAVTGAAVLVLHHFNKTGDARGSTAFAGAFDTVIEAKREGDTVAVRCQKQKDAEEFAPFTLIRRVIEFEERDERGRNVTGMVMETTEAAAAPLPKADATQERVFEALENSEDGLTATQWHKATGLSASRFYDHRDALVKVGRVTKEGKIYKTRQLTPITPITPISEKSEPKIHSDYSDDALASEQSELRPEGQKELFSESEQKEQPNRYGSD